MKPTLIKRAALMFIIPKGGFKYKLTINYLKISNKISFIDSFPPYSLLALKHHYVFTFSN